MESSKHDWTLLAPLHSSNFVLSSLLFQDALVKMASKTVIRSVNFFVLKGTLFDRDEYFTSEKKKKTVILYVSCQGHGLRLKSRND